MNDFDLELKARAKTEADPVPAGFEGRLSAKLDELPETAKKRARPRVLRTALVAAVLAVALTGTVLAAGTAAGFDFVQFFNGTKTGNIIVVYEDGTEVMKEYAVVYDTVGSDLVYFPVEELSEEVRAAAVYGEQVHLDLPTWEDAEDFLGLKIANSRTLEERGERKNSETYRHMIDLWGEEPSEIKMDVLYELDRITIHLTVLIKTDAVPQEYQNGSWMGKFDFKEDEGDGKTWSREDYLTANGLETVIIGSPPGRYKEALFTLNGMGYYIEAYGGDGDEASVLAALKEVLDGFQV